MINYKEHDIEHNNDKPRILCKRCGGPYTLNHDLNCGRDKEFNQITFAQSRHDAYEHAIALLNSDVQGFRNMLFKYISNESRYSGNIISAIADLELELKPSEVETLAKLCSSHSSDIAQSAVLALDVGGQLARNKLSSIITDDFKEVVKLSRNLSQY